MQPISNLTDHTGYWLRVVSNAVSQSFTRKVADEGVTVAEWVFMRMLYEVGAVSPSVLAQKMGRTKGAISKLAARLLEKKRIEQTDDPNDKRAHDLSLSKSGRRKVPVLSKLADENDAEYFDVLNARERAALSKILKALVERRRLSNVPMD
jgi:DNA-binding MarR family transcriptional regulator